MEQVIFLEGESGSDHREAVNELSRRYNCLIFDELYVKPQKLAALKFLNPEYIYIGTTGMFKEKIDVLIEMFDAVGWVPNNVIFSSERSAMSFDVEEYKKKGTKFYYDLNDELEEISWI